MTAYDRLPDWYKRDLDVRARNIAIAKRKVDAWYAAHPERRRDQRRPIPNCPQPDSKWRQTA